MSTVLRIGTQGKGQTAPPGGEDLDTRTALIQANPDCVGCAATGHCRNYEWQ